MKRICNVVSKTLIAFLILIGGVGSSLKGQKDVPAEIMEPKKTDQEILIALRNLPASVTRAQQAAKHENAATRTARAYSILEKSLKLTPGTLAKELPAFAKQILIRADTSEMDKANALFALGQFEESEAAALRVKNSIAALSLAAQSAAGRFQYKRALEHYRAAAALTSQTRDVLEWASVQNGIGWLLYCDGQYDAQASLMQAVWQACEKSGHQESAISLQSHNLWAVALYKQGKFAEAENEHRAVVSIQERVLGPEHPDTLQSRNKLALALNQQNKNAEAEKEHRIVLAIRERVLGPEHPDTLASRSNLAIALYFEGKYVEAEKQNRAVLAIQERVLGPEHRDTLRTCFNLCLPLEKLGRKAEALEYAKRAWEGMSKVLGNENPDTQAAKRRVEKLKNL